MSDINWLEKLEWGQDQIEDLRNIGYSYIRQGKYDIALSFYEALNILDPENVYDAQTLGALYLQINEPIKAIKYFDKALKLDAEHSPTLLNLTKAMFMLGKREEALRLCNILKKDKNSGIASVANALILAYS